MKLAASRTVSRIIPINAKSAAFLSPMLESIRLLPRSGGAPLVYSLQGGENGSAGSRGGGDWRPTGIWGDGVSAGARPDDRVRPAGAGGHPRLGVSGADRGPGGDHDPR